MTISTSPPIPDVLSFSELYLHLRTCIISHSRSLRLGALKILSSKLVKSSPGEHDVLKRCLQGEEVSLDVQGVRERVLRIGRIGQVIKDDEPLATDLCIRWLICEFPLVPVRVRLILPIYAAQLKVNLRPLWSPAAEALSSLAKRFGDSVWACLFDELKALTEVEKARGLPEWLNENVGEDVNDDPWEEERTWRDGAAHKIRSVISSWLDEDHDRKAIILVSVRLDLREVDVQCRSNRIRSPRTDSTLSHSRCNCSRRLGSVHHSQRNTTANSFPSSCRWRSTMTQFRVLPGTN